MMYFSPKGKRFISLFDFTPWLHSYLQSHEDSDIAVDFITWYFLISELTKDKDTADKAMIVGTVDWFHNYLDKHHEPTTMLVISGDVDMISTIEQL